MPLLRRGDSGAVRQGVRIVAAPEESGLAKPLIEPLREAGYAAQDRNGVAAGARPDPGAGRRPRRHPSRARKPPGTGPRRDPTQHIQVGGDILIGDKALQNNASAHRGFLTGSPRTGRRPPGPSP
ncbi:hypothetical protein GCM10010172_55210 [Paractinoplanes ferrugineus]|uniref:Uncharacterized protein n=1 Tax=Paractinoplanes ferrugineus TaxID=113564 RepID=A0A919J152_9ACTN|nr:hypothetical protein Afe05nite_28480 [Actinoplanes ferrugineus]